MANYFFFLTFGLVAINILIVHSVSDNYFGRDWAIWSKAKRIIETEIADKRALGIHPSTELKNFDVYTYGLKYSINPIYLVFPQNNAEFNLITGSGKQLKKDSTGKIEFLVAMPAREENTCGFVIMSSKDNDFDYISKIQISWTGNIKIPFELLAKPDTGETFYQLDLNSNHEKSAFFFDSVPAKYFKFNIFTNSGKPIKLKIASINKCIYNDRHIIIKCGEKLEFNKKFQYQSYGVPISVKCPTNCIRTWPCWGFKIYSSDSPICWAATQNFGKWGNGEYTLYKIKNVIFFRDTVNPLLNNGIYCRRSVTKYSGYTFDRKYYDFANKETAALSNAFL